MWEVYYVHVWIFQRGWTARVMATIRKVVVRVSVTWKDFSEVMVPELSWEFGSEQVDLFLEIGHKKHRCACGKLCGRYGTGCFSWDGTQE